MNLTKIFGSNFLTRSKFTQLVKDYDSDKDGVLSLAEFKELLRVADSKVKSLPSVSTAKKFLVFVRDLIPVHDRLLKSPTSKANTLARP